MVEELADIRVVALVDTQEVVLAGIQVAREDILEVEQVDIRVAQADTLAVDTLAVPDLEDKEDIQEVLVLEEVMVVILAEVVDTLAGDILVEAMAGTQAVAEDLADLEVLDHHHLLSMEPPLVNLVVLAVLVAYHRNMVLRAINSEVAMEVLVVLEVLDRHPVNTVPHRVVLEAVEAVLAEVARVCHPSMDHRHPTHSDPVIQIDTQALETPTVVTEDKNSLTKECLVHPLLFVLIFLYHCIEIMHEL